MDSCRRTGAGRRADHPDLGTGTRRIHAHRRISYRAPQGGGAGVFRRHRGLRHGIGQGQCGRQPFLRRHAHRAGQGIQENRVRPEQGHQHDSEIHDLPRGTAVHSADSFADSYGRRLGHGTLHRRMAASRGLRGRRRGGHDSRRLGAADFAELRGGRHASRPSQYAGAGARIRGDTGSRGRAEPR